MTDAIEDARHSLKQWLQTLDDVALHRTELADCLEEDGRYFGAANGDIVSLTVPTRENGTHVVSSLSWHHAVLAVGEAFIEEVVRAMEACVGSLSFVDDWEAGFHDVRELVEDRTFSEPEAVVRAYAEIADNSGVFPIGLVWDGIDRLSLRLEQEAFRVWTSRHPDGTEPALWHAFNVATGILQEISAFRENMELEGEEQGEDEKPPSDGMSWQEAAERLRELRKQGEPFTSQAKMAKQIGCSSATVNRAIKETPSLQAWAKPKEAAPKTKSLGKAVLGTVPQDTEADPTAVLPPDDLDAAMDYLMHNAGPDERAKIEAMPMEDRHRLASLAWDDPDCEG